MDTAFESFKKGGFFYKDNFFEVFKGGLFALIVSMVFFFFASIIGAITFFSFLILFKSSPLNIILFLFFSLIVLASISFLGLINGGWLTFSKLLLDKQKPHFSVIIKPPEKISFMTLPFLLILINLLIPGILGGLALASLFYIDGITGLTIAFVLGSLAGFFSTILNLLLSFSFYGIAIDGMGNFKSVSHSISIVKNNFEQFILLTLLISIISIVLSLIPFWQFLMILVTPWITFSMILFYRSIKQKEKTNAML